MDRIVTQGALVALTEGLGRYVKGLQTIKTESNISKTVSKLPQLLGVPSQELERVVARLAGLRKGDNYLVSSIDAYGSRAGSTYRGRGPIPTSDLDIMVKMDGRYLDDDWVRKTIGSIQTDFEKVTGFKLSIKSDVVRRNMPDVKSINLFKRR